MLAELPPLAGVRLAAAPCDIRYSGRTDACLVEIAQGATMAGLLTKSKTAGAPVEWCRAALTWGTARALVVNSGNANAFTGGAGKASVERTADAVARLYDCPRHDVYIASTGVIGEALPDEKITAALGGLKDDLSPGAWLDAAQAIMTTDTFPKLAMRNAKIGETKITINGIAKGSGMIAPDLATMLAFVFTDAAIPAEVLERLLRPAVADTFNSITVDGDTSTSDTLLLCATGQADHEAILKSRDPILRSFRTALRAVLRDLAQQVVRDGEGAQKLITIRVTGAASKRAARCIGLAIGNSPLVKTAIGAGDANWGRIVMAVGKSGERAERDLLSIRIGGVEIARRGAVVPDYDEAPVAEHMKGSEIDIEVDVGIKRGRATVWTCDLTHGYISINADYRS